MIQSLGETLRFTLAILPLIFATSCHKDDDISHQEIEGANWIVVSRTVTNCADPNSNGAETFECSASNCLTMRLSNGILTWSSLYNGLISDSSPATYDITANIIVFDQTNIWNFSFI